MITVDFETEAIEDRPKYPPRPVGVAIKRDDAPAEYLAWGHPSGNNSTLERAKEALGAIWAGPEGLLFHNAKFDLDVARGHFGLPLPPAQRIHDTMFLLFLHDPHSSTISLKPSAERLLGWKPEEQDAVAEWLWSHGVIPRTVKAGPYIARCDGGVVGRYACGDVDRTKALFDKLHPLILEAGMGPAYMRERLLLPILLSNERAGIRVDMDRLGEDLVRYEASLVLVEAWLRKALKVPSLNLDADAEVAEALHRVGAVTEWVLTPTGRRSTAKKNLKINHPALAHALDYRNRLQNVLAQSMRPWYSQASPGDGRIYTEWNQVRTSRGADVNGTRTGRLSCARFMNIAKAFSITEPGFIRGTLPLPLVRRYLIPDEGGIWVHRDYNQQEFRILAHYENDRLLQSYRDNPRIDYHDNMIALVDKATGVKLERKDAKILNFGINYGMGAGKFAAGLGVSVEEATRLRNAVKAAAPGVQALDRELKRRGRAGEPVRTWGGRRYFCEPPSEDGRTFEYKLLNYLIQGSAADCTKEAIIRWYGSGGPGRLLVTVHDEINVSVPAEALDEGNEMLRQAMEEIPFDVPMLTDGKVGLSWGDLKKESK